MVLYESCPKFYCHNFLCVRCSVVIMLRPFLILHSHFYRKLGTLNILHVPIVNVCIEVSGYLSQFLTCSTVDTASFEWDTEQL